MNTKLFTPKFRAAFISIFKATRPSMNPDAKPKYSIRACFPPEADLKALKEAAQAVAKEKWGSSIPKTLRSPFRRNEELDNPIPGLGDDWIVCTFSANEDRRPGIVDAHLQDIIDEADVYSGAWYRCEVRPYAYEQAGNRGVSFGLENVQKLAEGEPLGAARTPANKAFTAVDVPEGEGGKTTAALFD